MSELKSLGYITISTSDVDRWRQFAFGVLGFAEGKGPDPSALYLRTDERAARLIVVPGETTRRCGASKQPSTVQECHSSSCPSTRPKRDGWKR
jgi:hypothetical protein